MKFNLKVSYFDKPLPFHSHYYKYDDKGWLHIFKNSGVLEATYNKDYIQSIIIVEE